MALHKFHCWAPVTTRELLKREASFFIQQADKSSSEQLKGEYDAVVVGGGHNGLVAAAYLQKAGINTCVLERRHIVGGAAVTEEIIPGFKFSRASYVLSLLRPAIYKDLELKKHGLKVYQRNPNSYTPLEESNWKNGKPRSLTMYMDKERKLKEISQFSPKDAQAYVEYDKLLTKFGAAVAPLLDHLPPDANALLRGSSMEKMKSLKTFKPLVELGRSLGQDFQAFVEFVTAPASKILDRWFDTDPLKATLATDSVIGAMQAPSTPGSGYVLLHHIMGDLDGVPGIWGYVEGGMGSVTQILAKVATSLGAEIFVDKTVSQIKVTNGKTTGVVLENGREINAKLVLSNATPKVTFLDLIDKQDLPEDFIKDISRVDYTSPTTKINIALKGLPNFLANPSDNDKPMLHHHGSIHINCEKIAMLEDAYKAGSGGNLPQRPMIEMVIPSSLDPTLAPKGCHVCLLFTQFTPYNLANGKQWNVQTKKEYFDIVIDSVERYAPGFRDIIAGYEVLTPPDLEEIFGLTGGNIFHGAMTLDQIYTFRPSSHVRPPHTPVKGLFMCGSGSHPGGGVMGASGRLGALVAATEFRKK